MRIGNPLVSACVDVARQQRTSRGSFRGLNTTSISLLDQRANWLTRANERYDLPTSSNHLSLSLSLSLSRTPITHATLHTRRGCNFPSRSGRSIRFATISSSPDETSILFYCYCRFLRGKKRRDARGTGRWSIDVWDRRTIERFAEDGRDGGW